MTDDEPPLHIRPIRLATQICVIVKGVLDHRTGGVLERRLRDLAGSGPPILLDLAGVTHADAHGARSLAAVRRHFTERDVGLTVWPCSDAVILALEKAGVRKLVTG